MKNLFQPFRSLAFTFFLSLSFLSITLPVYAQQRGTPPSQPDHAQSTLSRFHYEPGRRIVGTLPALKRAQLKAQLKGQSPLTSYNGTGDIWSGYTVGSGIGKGFRAVEANWNAPCVSGNINNNTRYASWVGLGGYFPTNNPEPLEQAGILLQNDGTYRLFWEYITTTQPPSVDTVDVIHCGDPIKAWVILGYNFCANGGFYAHVEDDSKSSSAHWGSTCTPEAQYGYQSADWIDERPANTLICNGFAAPVQLADFRYTDWTNVQAQANNSGAVYKGPNSFGNTQIMMYDYGLQYWIAEPDGLSVNSNNTFTDRWYSVGTLCD